MPDTPGQSPSAGPDTGGRLNTWKEIATYLGKGVRTVERWEKTLGLPVHRVASPRGDSVYGLKREIDAWLATVDRRKAEAASEAGRPRRRASPAQIAGRDRAPNAQRLRRVLVSLPVLFMIAAAAWWVWLGPRAARLRAQPGARPSSTGPVSWRILDGQVAVFDGAGRHLWTTRLPFKLDPAACSTPWGNGSRVALADVDGDRRRELLVGAGEDVYHAHTLHCYDSDGKLRFEYAPGRTVRFGDVDYTPPFVVDRMWFTAESGTRQANWLVANHALGPSAVYKLDGRGNVLSEYWGFGQVGTLQEVTIGGRRLMLVGASNNESRGASLAVLDYDNASAVAPAVTDPFRCRICPGKAAPLHFFVLPLDDVSRAAGPTRVTIVRIMLDVVRDRIVVVTFSAAVIGSDAAQTEWSVLYTFDLEFNLVNVDFVEAYRPTHARLQAMGLLNHPFGDRDYREASRVIGWDGTRFVPVRVLRRSP